MAFFQYKAVTVDGKVVEGTLEAADEKSVLARLEEQGQLPIRIQSEGAAGLLGQDFTLPWKRKRVTHGELLVFTQELSTLVEAGLPLDRSLTILGDLTENEHLKSVVKALLSEIKSGKSLSEGLAQHPKVFPKIYTNMVKAGEISGTLDQILRRLGEYLESTEELRAYVTSSLIYPGILVSVASGSFLILVGFVIPRFAEIFDNAGAPIPLPMKGMLLLSGFLTGYWWTVVLAALAGWYFFRRWLRSEDGRMSWDKNLLKTPLLGDVLQKIEVSRFSRTLGTLLKSSVPMIQSINIVREVIGNQAIVSAMEPIKSGVKKGEGLVQPVRRSGVFPAFAVHLLEVGEETGRLDTMLLQIADTYDRELRTAFKRLIALFEPAVILVMGLVFGVMIVSILYSILSINDVPL